MGSSSKDTYKTHPAESSLFFSDNAQGNLSNTKGVGTGVLECRIDSGPGYRVYFGRDGDALIILLGGGTKTRQQKNIKTTHDLWQEYRRRKRRET